jgi:hypothetical protein
MNGARQFSRPIPQQRKNYDSHYDTPKNATHSGNRSPASFGIFTRSASVGSAAANSTRDPRG